KGRSFSNTSASNNTTFDSVPETVATISISRTNFRYSTAAVRTPANCTRYGENCIRATTPSGKGAGSPFSRRISTILHTGHLPGKSETTPGHMGHQYSMFRDKVPLGTPDGRVS